MGVVWATPAAINAGAVIAQINKRQSAPGGGRAIEWISFSIRDLMVNRHLDALPLLVVFQVFAMETFHHASSWRANMANAHETPALSQEGGKAPQRMKRFSFWGREDSDGLR
jgi:hypothetical protein